MIKYRPCNKPRVEVSIRQHDYQCLQHFIVRHAARPEARYLRSLWFLIISSRGLQCDMSILSFPSNNKPISLLTSSLIVDLIYADIAIENASGNLLSFADASVNVCSAHIHIPIKN